MNNELSFLSRYAKNLRPDFFYDAARAMDADPPHEMYREPEEEPDEDRESVSADDVAELRDLVMGTPRNELTDDISLSELVEQLQRPAQLRTNPDNEREFLAHTTRQERSAETWLDGLESYLAQVLELPPRERRMQLRVLREHAHTFMSAIERRSVDLPPGDPRLDRLDRLAQGLERLIDERHSDAAFSGAAARQREEAQRIGDEARLANRATQTLDHYVRLRGELRAARAAEQSRAKAADQQPESDLEFYQRRAADSTQLS